MFKSVFFKYLSAFMLIITISFSIIMILISLIIGEYAENEKENIMETAASSVANYLKAELEENQFDSLPSLLQANRSDVDAILRVASKHSDDLTLLLIDQSGALLTVIGYDEGKLPLDQPLPSSLTQEVMKNDGGMITQRINLFQEEYAVYAMPIVTAPHQTVGSVLVCTSPNMTIELTQTITRVILHSILWILIAALIAVYCVTERIVAPLRAIRSAAKSFSEGNFDVRVPVRGKDEVAQLAIALNNMAESMRQYDTMRNTFMSNVSHDLRTPMTSITGFIDGILDGVIPPEKHHYYLQLVSTEVKRLSRLVSSLLDLSRIQAGERKFTIAPFDICEMGREILISFEQKIEERQLDVEFLCAQENIDALADRDAIHQILYNLCDNAVKFSRQGGRLRISIQKLKNRKLLVSVYNEGQGISTEDIPHVFDRFYKSDKSRGLNKSGVGLGLFIAKTIIDAHGEKIWVESQVGVDCCFNFTLSYE